MGYGGVDNIAMKEEIEIVEDSQGFTATQPESLKERGNNKYKLPWMSCAFQISLY